MSANFGSGKLARELRTPTMGRRSSVPHATTSEIAVPWRLNADSRECKPKIGRRANRAPARRGGMAEARRNDCMQAAYVEEGRTPDHLAALGMAVMVRL
jgi:hypothetical protein